MAIKVTGTTVINDSRELENVTDMPNFIKKPTITSPTNNETDTDLALTIQGTPYNAVFDGSRDYREFQVDLDSGDFSSPIRTNQVNDDSWVVDPSLDGLTSFKVRIRDVDLDGNVTDWSDEVTFTTVDPITVAALGDSVCGGFYMGTIAAAGTTYYLIVSPNSSGCAACLWKTSDTDTPNACSTVDGYANTYNALNNTSHPAGNWTATRTINGFSDWYMPAHDEMRVVYLNGAGSGDGDSCLATGPLPAAENFGFNACHWASNQYSSYAGRVFGFIGGEAGNNSFFDKSGYNLDVRAFRREPV